MPKKRPSPIDVGGNPKDLLEAIRLKNPELPPLAPKKDIDISGISKEDFIWTLRLAAKESMSASPLSTSPLLVQRDKGLLESVVRKLEFKESDQKLYVNPKPIDAIYGQGFTQKIVDRLRATFSHSPRP